LAFLAQTSLKDLIVPQRSTQWNLDDVSRPFRVLRAAFRVWFAQSLASALREPNPFPDLLSASENFSTSTKPPCHEFKTHEPQRETGAWM
jgi:hypothetical protein